MAINLDIRYKIDCRQRGAGMGNIGRFQSPLGKYRRKLIIQPIPPLTVTSPTCAPPTMLPLSLGRKQDVINTTHMREHNEHLVPLTLHIFSSSDPRALK